MATLLHRLRERKLVQWGTAYLAGAFASCQILDAVSEPLGLSTLILRGVLVVLGAGFFITLTLAWYHGEQGRQTVSGPELLVVALLFVIAGTGIALVQGAGGTAEAVSRNRQGPASGPLEAGAPSVAVLPFTDMSAAGDQRYFGDGIAEEILNSLARISGLKVAARTSAFQLRDENVATVGAQLGVANVLEGSVRRDGERVRITAQLIHVADGFHLWSETFDRVVTDVFAIQEEIAEAIAGALKVELGLHPTGVRERGLTDDMDAYDLYLLGRARWAARSPTTIREAIDYFQRAVEKDSMFALAWSGIADAYAVLPFYDPDVDGRDVHQPAKAAALRAYGLSPDLAEVHTSLGYIAWTYDYDWEGADAHLSRAVGLAPGYATAQQWYGQFLQAAGESDEGLRHLQIALGLDPQSNILRDNAAAALAATGRTAEARTLWEAAIRSEPVIPRCLMHLAWNLSTAEPVDAPRAAELYADYLGTLGYQNRARVTEVALRGSSDDVLALLRDVMARTGLDAVDLLPFWVATPPDEFLPVLEKAVEAKSREIFAIPPIVTSAMPELTRDPRWQAFLERINYPSAVPAGEGPP